MKSIILIAPPAAGKGTQSSLIEKTYHIPHISTSDLIRKMISENNEKYGELQKSLDNGILISDDIILELLKVRLSNKDCSNGYILDGFPRNINQAYCYEEILKELNLNESIVIYLSLDKTIAEKRVLGRMVCPNCKSVYNKYFIETSPKLDGVCDKCNTKLEKRVDDNIETFDKRYDTYCKETKPLIDFYKSKNILCEIDSSLSKEIVFDKIKKVLEDLE